MNKIRIIDLLNKIANDEKFDNCKMKFKGIEPEMVNEYVIYDKLYEEDLTLNDEVEIIEKDKKIEKIDMLEFRNLNDYEKLEVEKLKNIINELIDEVNKLKENK